MFAFAIWDMRSERLLLGRDRMGVKPLYYYPTDDGVLFGSEPKAILAYPMASRVVDLDGLRELFASVKTPGAAIWRGMREVVPGTLVTVDRAAAQLRRRLHRPGRQLRARRHARHGRRPYVQHVVRHAGTDHRDIVLDPATLADPAAREAVVGARDIPAFLGDMDQSLYLLFAAIREHSTVALSGESADEVFGGYRWFHEPDIQAAEMFPWLATTQARHLTRPAGVDPDLLAALDLDAYIEQRYREAVAEIPVIDGQSDHEARLRRMCYLNLTRFVRILLDRKDRISMAVGLEVRVPFCDHRLVDYVLNAGAQ
jgi:asparagine synthetase B (glutamine-hydrolysing)